MAIYEYEREDGTSFEVHQSVKEYKRLEKCPTTGKKCKRIVRPDTIIGFADPFMHTVYVTGKDAESATWAENANDKFSK